jgi:hypothetical protein
MQFVEYFEVVYDIIEALSVYLLICHLSNSYQYIIHGSLCIKLCKQTNLIIKVDLDKSADNISGTDCKTIYQKFTSKHNIFKAVRI